MGDIGAYVHGGETAYAIVLEDYYLFQETVSIAFFQVVLHSRRQRLTMSRFHINQLLALEVTTAGDWTLSQVDWCSEVINMYLLSRFLFGLSRLAVEKGYIPEPKQDPFPIFAAVTWGIVLWLFEYHRHTLQPSLQSSMTYLYDDSNVWHDISDFLIYNKSNAQK